MLRHTFMQMFERQEREEIIRWVTLEKVLQTLDQNMLFSKWQFFDGCRFHNFVRIRSIYFLPGPL